MGKRILRLIFHGHSSDCPAPKERCSCEKHLYLITGALALIAGIAQILVGLRFSMAVLSDSLHALADAGADFMGVFIAHKVNGSPHREEEIRVRGNRIVAMFLFVGAVLIAHEAYERWGEGNVVWLPAVITVGLFGLVIDLLRLRMLSQAYQHSAGSTLRALIEHARSDAYHNGIISIMAGVALLGGVFFQRDGYQRMVGYADCIASIILAGYMAFILTPRIWRGGSCCGPPKKEKGCCDHDGNQHPN